MNASYICTQCGMALENKTNFISHMRNHYNADGIEHMKIHGYRPYKCLQCDMVFAYNSDLIAHMRSHSGKIYQCTQCDIYFSDNSYLIRHMSSHTHKIRARSVKPFPLHYITISYPCKQCDKVFPDKNTLSQHMKIHTAEKVCDKCGVAFECAIELELHMKWHANRNLYKCRSCDGEFTSNRELELHSKNHVYQGDDKNTGEAIIPYHCKQYDKPFRGTTSIVSHMRAYAGERPHHCSHCDKIFSPNTACIEPKKTHEEQSYYQCLKCGMAFSYVSDCTAHMRSHTGEDFHCKQCGIVISDKKQFIHHMGIHSGQKQYQSSKCDEAFSSIKIHSGDHCYNSDTNTVSELKVEVKEEGRDDNLCDLKIEAKDELIDSYNSDTDTASETEFEMNKINDDNRIQYDLYAQEFQGKDCHFNSIQSDTDKLLEPKIEIKEGQTFIYVKDETFS